MKLQTRHYNSHLAFQGMSSLLWRLNILSISCVYDSTDATSRKLKEVDDILVSTRYEPTNDI